MEYGHLEQVEQGIVDEYRFPKSGYIVDVYRLSCALGVTVSAESLDDGISGSLECVNDGKFIIKVAESEPNGRKRFTIAHELGHYALHKDKIKKKDGIIEENILYRSEKFGDKDEQEANAFAADLIMPRKQIGKALKNTKGLEKEYGGNDILEVMANAFDVSKLAMSIRLGMQA